MKLDHKSLEPYGSAYIPMFYPPIIIERHFPKAFCEHLVKTLDNKAVASGVHDSKANSAKVDNYHRSSTAVIVEAGLYNDVAMLMTTAVNSHAMLMLAKKAELCEPLQFLKYDAKVKGHFLPHTDNAYFDAKGVFQYTSPKRHLTCVAYINEDYEGGDFIMHSVKDDEDNSIKLKPKVGELVIFPPDIRFCTKLPTLPKAVDTQSSVGSTLNKLLAHQRPEQCAQIDEPASERMI
jgi:predicted 2-oxoglutarate/Fe(II)-dependent dioxygenase YbiX